MADFAPPDSFPSGYERTAGFLIFGNCGSIDCVQMLPVSSGTLFGFFRLINIQEDSLQLLYRRDIRFSFCRGRGNKRLKLSSTSKVTSTVFGFMSISRLPANEPITLSS